MTEPATTLHPHRPTDPTIDLDSDPDFVGPPDPRDAAQGEPPPISAQQRLVLAQQIHNVTSTLLNATVMLEAIPEEIWDRSFEVLAGDLYDTAHAAARQARIAYEKVLAVEVLLAKAMR